MLTQLLARMSANLPSEIKYKLSSLRGPYTALMRLGQPKLKVPTIAGELNWEIDELITQEIIRGTYEIYMQKAFAEFIRPGSVVYDVGAHAGYHSLLCALLAGPTGQGFAFEPHPLNRQSIQRQIAVNPDLNLTLLPYALSDSCTDVYLNCDKGRSQSFLSAAGEFVVAAKTIDHLVETESVPPPYLMKVDVEGHEVKALAGGIKTIEKYHPIILCDPNDDTTAVAVSDLLSPLGYRVSGDLPIVCLPDGSES
jgi:FkbM family methyltransferase